jgi:hypothetical protein
MRRIILPVVVVLAAIGFLWNTVAPAFGAPSLANLTADNAITFTSPGFNTAHDINVVDNAGALRFYGCPQLTTTPSCAAIQFFGNFANTFGGQMFLDSGAETNAAIILRTAGSGQTISERMRVTNTGKVGIGTSTPISSLQVVGDFVQIPVYLGANPPASSCDAPDELGRIALRGDGPDPGILFCAFSPSPSVGPGAVPGPQTMEWQSLSQ